MSRVVKPVVLNETGKATNRKIEAIGPIIDQTRISLEEQIPIIGEKIDQARISMEEQIPIIGARIDALTVVIPSIIEAMDRLDIIYYVEQV